MDLSALRTLSSTHRAALKKGNIRNVSDLLLLSNVELAKKCRLAPTDAQNIVDLVCKELYKPAELLEEVAHQGSETFTTGDSRLDNALGGGIRTGMLWEIVGESAAGKTQIALQASLFVQLPSELRGLCGSACYLTTSSKLQTNRLVQLSKSHPLLSSSLCSLSDIHTMTTATVPILLHVLSTTFPALIKQTSNDPDKKPVKLLVIDALTELFHSSGKTSTNTLFERSKNITEISTLLHAIASEHQIAILVLNEVVDVVDRGWEENLADDGNMVYRDQARWFNRADSVPGQDKKEAGLGLAWANQVNARIMCSRTGRRRNLDAPGNKRRRLDSSASGDHHDTHIPYDADSPTLIRRLTVIFSSVSVPSSLDYIITVQGFSSVDGEDTEPLIAQGPQGRAAPAPLPSNLHSRADDNSQPDSSRIQAANDEPDEWDAYWDQLDDSDNIYDDVDLAILESTNTTST